MDIREVTEDEKKLFVQEIKRVFREMRQMIDGLETDITSPDLTLQATAVWISGNLGKWFYDFVSQVRNLHEQKEALQNEIKEITEERGYEQV